MLFSFQSLMNEKQPSGKSEDKKHPLPNLVRLGGSDYIVRAQAGFNKLIRQLKRMDSDDIYRIEVEDNIEPNNYPKSYSSFVRVYYGFFSYHYCRFNCFPLEHYLKDLESRLSTVQQHLSKGN